MFFEKVGAGKFEYTFRPLTESSEEDEEVEEKGDDMSDSFEEMSAIVLFFSKVAHVVCCVRFGRGGTAQSETAWKETRETKESEQQSIDEQSMELVYFKRR